MEGIDPTLVRTALQGNFERYVRLCAQFMEQAQAAPEEITAALNSQDVQAALNTLHGVRGAAVTPGMKRLAAAGSHVAAAPVARAHDREGAIRASRPVHDALGEYAKTLAQLEQALSTWLSPASKDLQDSPV